MASSDARKGFMSDKNLKLIKACGKEVHAFDVDGMKRRVESEEIKITKLKNEISAIAEENGYTIVGLDKFHKHDCSDLIAYANVLATNVAVRELLQIDVKSLKAYAKKRFGYLASKDVDRVAFAEAILAKEADPNADVTIETANEVDADATEEIENEEEDLDAKIARLQELKKLKTLQAEIDALKAAQQSKVNPTKASASAATHKVIEKQIAASALRSR
jgi:hypothetical protein